MEVGAVKQAFNNEVIQLKKNLNQAKIQVIHKLTRKAKTLTEKKKAPENIQAKNKKKAESAVKEVLIIKKLKPRDIARFIITNKAELNTHLNKPIVDNDKACARLLLHKALQQKYKMVKDKFGDIPIKDLLMSRQERLKLKKEAKEAQKKKKKGKESKIVNSEGDWNVEDVAKGKDISKYTGSDDVSDDEGSNDENSNADESNDDVLKDGDENVSDDEDIPVTRQVVNGSDESSDEEVPRQVVNGSDLSSEGEEPTTREENSSDESDDEEMEENEDVGSDDRDDDASDDQDNEESDENEIDMIDHTQSSSPASNIKPNIKIENPKMSAIKPQTKSNKKEATNLDIEDVLSTLKPKKKPDKKVKENKNKNLNEKMLNRKFKKDSSDSHTESKTVDPFFKTATGGSYMSVAEPRQPDEFKEIHRQGNRQERRAVMFGRAPIRPRNNKPDFRSGKFERNDSNNKFNKFENRNDKFNNRNEFNDKNSRFNDSSKLNNRNSNFNDKNTNFNGRNGRGSSFNDTDSKFNRNSKFNDKNSGNDRAFNNKTDTKEEKLHPSWEAKKKQSGILPYKGKKIVFDES